MPILKQEPDIFPHNLLAELVDDKATDDRDDEGEANRWWAMYTLSRREKQLMRDLREMEIPFYSPVIPKRYRSPNGRIRESYIPLFANYVFVYGTASQRYEAVTTGNVSRYLDVPRALEFTEQLRQVQRLITLKRPLTSEARLNEGDPIRIKTGVFRGFEGYVIRRQHKTRLLVWVHLLNQGVSAELDEAVLESAI